jgi:hypothetical protein
VKLLRTTPSLVRLLVGLFLVAQAAGLVSMPRASALPIAAALASHDHNQHALNQAGHGERHDHHDHDGLADRCCGLHACFVGVLPPVTAVETAGAIGEPLSAATHDLALGIPGGRLDRPPRPLH